MINVVDPLAPEDSRVSRLADLSTGGHKVLTGLAQGPDGNLYVVNLMPAPFRAGAAMIRQVTLDGDVSEITAGITAGSGLAVAPDGTMYVAEIARSIGQPPFLVPPGRIVTAADGSVQEASAPLMFPTILRWGSDGALYAANFGVAGNESNGSIVRVDLS